MLKCPDLNLLSRTNMNDPNDPRKTVIKLIQQNLQLPPDQQRFWQLFVAYKAKDEQLPKLKEIFGRFPTKVESMLAHQIGMSEQNQKVTNKFIQHLGKTYQTAVTNANRKPQKI